MNHTTLCDAWERSSWLSCLIWFLVLQQRVMSLSTYSRIDNSQSYRIICSNARNSLLILVRISFILQSIFLVWKVNELIFMEEFSNCSNMYSFLCQKLESKFLARHISSMVKRVCLSASLESGHFQVINIQSKDTSMSVACKSLEDLVKIGFLVTGPFFHVLSGKRRIWLDIQHIVWMRVKASLLELSAGRSLCLLCLLQHERRVNFSLFRPIFLSFLYYVQPKIPNSMVGFGTGNEMLLIIKTKMYQWLSRGSWVVGGTDSAVQRTNDHCNEMIKCRQALLENQHIVQTTRKKVIFSVFGAESWVMDLLCLLLHER